MKICILLALLAACAREPDKNPDPEPSPLPFTFEQVEARALDMTSPWGWVVSLKGGARFGKSGDSAYFTGLGMGLFDCATGAVLERALLDMLASEARFYRHPSLIGEEPSLDPVLAILWGVHQRIAKCPEAVATWREWMPVFADATTWYRGVFDAVLWQVESELGLRAPPSETERGEAAAAVAVWAHAVVLDHAAAFRLHLGFLVLDILVAPKGRAEYCSAVAPAQMPLLEQFCGRPGLAAWTQAFQYDGWEYFHQRSPAWETPDGRGATHPGLDYLMALQLLRRNGDH